MRKWVREVFVDGPLPAYRNNFEIQRRRPKQDVRKEIFPIHCSNGSGDFNLWLYEPTAKPIATRPVILMFHGGGWIHGDPSADDGESFT